MQKISFFFGHHCYKYCHYHPSCYCYKYCHYQTYQTILPLNYGMILAPRSWWAAALSPRKHAVFLALLVSGAFLNEKMWISCWIHWNMMIWTLEKLLLADLLLEQFNSSEILRVGSWRGWTDFWCRKHQWGPGITAREARIETSWKASRGISWNFTTKGLLNVIPIVFPWWSTTIPNILGSTTYHKPTGLSEIAQMGTVQNWREQGFFRWTCGFSTFPPLQGGHPVNTSRGTAVRVPRLDR